ncbi:hypothetical protein CYMTET_50773 [Cymbomonas tetramitiformis]|uniref:Uncharacterized protein n=1 Tax=Cymbomonas tetramitiformis TaxID=36881 RepID=A0AAE0EST6_9CHLO|nr:hypothetical protein CYMTET_50773 [Cymbomonas tetramitiformis]
MTREGVAGVSASAVVVYSEWVLKSTGCGLPPGPYGLEGAVEGLSYLGVAGFLFLSLSKKLRTGKGLPAGEYGVIGAAEGLAYLATTLGIVVLLLQLQEYGYIPGALPDSNCFG